MVQATGDSKFDAALIVPFLVFSVPVVYFGTRLYKRFVGSQPKNDPAVTGIGRGAPGFLTSVKKVQVPAHLVARIRAGEEVSAEEITAAIEAEQRKQEEEADNGSATPAAPKRKVKEGVDESWLPPETSGSGKARRRKR